MDTEETPAVMTENAESAYQLPDGAQELIEKFNPGADVSTPEAAVEALCKIVKDMAPFYDKSYDLATSDPSVAGFMADMLETGSVPKALARNFDPEELKSALEEMGEDDYEEDKAVYAGKVAKAKQVEANKQVSIAHMDDFMEQRKGWPPEKADAFVAFLLAHYEDAKDGKITPENIELLEKGFTHDDDVAEAEENGKVMGMNEKIVARKMSKEETDRLLPEGGVGVSKETPVKKQPVLSPRQEFRV
jgi:hypothetical protein